MIRVESLTKEYRSGRGRVSALSGVSFCVEKGAVAVLYGKSGSGKTTLLYCVGGLLRPDKGKISVFGADLTSLTLNELCLFQRKELGFVFQSGNLLSYLNVYDNIAFPLIMCGWKKVDIQKRVQGLGAEIGLSSALKALPSELSGGEAQRVALARAMAHRPKLILADEPTASLDTTTGKALVELMVSVAKEAGSTMIISTHDPEIIRLAGKGIHIKDGQVAD
ncbi:ABC transporter ATP-binding protein [bacterium]|nr:MAG: ABC transporter ATP-binding protein [bacterium]